MKSGTTATIAGAVVLALVLLGLATQGLQLQRANAQRVDAPAPSFSTPPTVTHSPSALLPPSSDGSRLAPPTTSPWQPSRLEGPPHRGLSVPPMHPITVVIKGGPQLRGEPVNLAAFAFTTVFGPVSIPVNTIRGVRMADDPREPAAICLSNGDCLTGLLTTDSITINTAWGGATIVRDHIVSIRTSADPLSWHEQNGRWTIVTDVTDATEPDAKHAEESGEAGDPLLPPVSSAAPAFSSTSSFLEAVPAEAD